MKKQTLLTLFICALALSGCSAKPQAEQSTPAAAEAVVSSESEASSEPSSEPSTEASKEKTPESTQEQPASKAAAELSDNIYDFQISIDGTVYQFPMSYEDLTAQGWKYSGSGSDGLSAGSYTSSDWFKNGGSQFMAYIVNFDINEQPLTQCYIGGINAEALYMKDAEILMAKGIKMGESTAEDVKTAYGEPTDSYESESYPTMTYQKDFYESVKFTFDTASGGTLSDVQIKNLTQPDDFQAGSVSTDIPPAAAAYKAPSGISDDFLEYTAEYAGGLYRLPAPVSEFLNNGWNIIEDETEPTIPGRSSGKVTMMKDNQKFWTFVYNYSENAASCENCFVTLLKASSFDCNVPMTVSKGIVTGMSQADLEAALDGTDYEKEDNSSYILYSISDEASLTYGYDISVRDGAVSSIEMQFDPGYKDFMSSLGL